MDEETYWQQLQREQEEAYWQAEREAYYNEQRIAQLEEESGRLEYEQTLIGEDGYSGGWTQSSIIEALTSIGEEIRRLKKI